MLRMEVFSIFEVLASYLRFVLKTRLNTKPLTDIRRIESHLRHCSAIICLNLPTQRKLKFYLQYLTAFTR